MLKTESEVRKRGQRGERGARIRTGKVSLSDVDKMVWREVRKEERGRAERGGTCCGNRVGGHGGETRWGLWTRIRVTKRKRKLDL